MESLHARIRRLADREGISINQFILLAAVEKAKLLESGNIGQDYITARAKRAEETEADPRKVFKEFVEGAPEVAPVPEDRIE